MNIVSIDFDIIMAPSIQLYHVCNGEEVYEDYYKNLFNADLKMYTKLTNWLVEWITKVGVDNVYFIESHDQIVNFIPKQGEHTVINIDHHHDLGYGTDEEMAANEENFHLDCGNWGYYLFKNNLIQNFIWIRNYNSSLCMHHKYPYNTKLFNHYNFNNLKADKIIICLSEPWVPKQYHTLFYSWMDIASKLNNTQYYLIENN